MQDSPAITIPPDTVSFTQALGYWLKLGFISFGGPAGQIAIMHEELVERRRWISEQRFLHALNYTMMLPGPEAQQLATYIGWLMHGTKGGIAAGVLFVLPSLFILIFLTWVYLAFGHRPEIAGILYGIKPAVVAIVAFAVYRIGSRAITNTVMLLIALLAFATIFTCGFLYPSVVTFPYIIFAATLIGYIGSRITPDKFKTGGTHGMSNKHYGPALIDDETIRAAHTHFAWKRI
ncbi:MAG: chromate transporter, partial [Gammaproteobacteria bacterium]